MEKLTDPNNWSPTALALLGFYKYDPLFLSRVMVWDKVRNSNEGTLFSDMFMLWKDGDQTNVVKNIAREIKAIPEQDLIMKFLGFYELKDRKDNARKYPNLFSTGFMHMLIKKGYSPDALTPLLIQFLNEGGVG